MATEIKQDKINFENLFLNIFIFLTIIILFLNFFVLHPIYPSSDEIVAVERYTEWWKFLRKDSVGNHIINSFVAVIIKSIFGFNFLYYRFISFFSFCLIILIFKKMFPSTIAYFILIFLILTSQMLTSYIYIFRGYYIWAFLTVLNFYFIKNYISNNFDNRNYNIILFLNLIMACHAIFTFYIVIPTLLIIFFTAIKKKDLKKINNFFILFLIPFCFFYFLASVLEGFVNNFTQNLTLNYLLNNFFYIVKVGFFSGFNSIFFSGHTMQYLTNDNTFIKVFNQLTTRGDVYDYQFTILFIYIVSFFILIFRILKKKINIIDWILIFIIFFFYILKFVPELRVHVGIVYFFIFYIFENIYKLILNISKKLRFKFLFLSLFFIFLFFRIDSPDNKISIDTKKEIINIRNLIKIYSCSELSNILNEHEIWIIKNIFSKDCSSKYDFINNKNILF